MERISSAKSKNRRPGLQRRNRKDSDSESDNEEEDNNNTMPGLQDRDREDSSSEDDTDDERDQLGTKLSRNTEERKIKTKLVRKKRNSEGIKTKSVRNSELNTKSVRNSDQIRTKSSRNSEPSQLRTNLSRIAEEILPHCTPEKRLAPMESEGEPTANGDEGTNSEEDLFFVSSDDEGEEEDSVQNNNNYNNENEASTTTTTTTPTPTTTTPTTTLQPTTPNKMKITQENLPFGHICDDIAIGNDTPYVRVYCQNVCGIYDRDGIGLDSAFNEMKKAGADIFTFNETHGDESNALAR